MLNRLAHRNAVLAWLITGGVLVAVMSAIQLGKRSVHASHQSLSLLTNVMDLGHTLARKEWHVPFRVSNVGDRRLIINQVDAACGCGSLTGKSTIVPAGETIDVEVKLDTRFVVGPVENTASFTTSDPAHPRFSLTVRAFVAVDDPVVFNSDDPN